MVAFARKGKTDPTVRMLAVELTKTLAQKDYKGEVKYLTEFVRDRIRYIRDIYQVEYLQTPYATLKARSGDCDDKSVLLASLLLSIGHPTRFVACDSSGNGVFNHVYVETKLGRVWVPLETTEPVDAGCRMPEHKRLERHI